MPQLVHFCSALLRQHTHHHICLTVRLQAKEAKREAKHAAHEAKQAGEDAGGWVDDKSGGLLDSAGNAVGSVGSKAHDAYDAVADKVCAVQEPGLALLVLVCSCLWELTPAGPALRQSPGYVHVQHRLCFEARHHGKHALRPIACLRDISLPCAVTNRQPCHGDCVGRLVWCAIYTGSMRVVKLQVDELRHDAKEKVEAEVKEADKRAISPGACSAVRGLGLSNLQCSAPSLGDLCSKATELVHVADVVIREPLSSPVEQRASCGEDLADCQL